MATHHHVHSIEFVEMRDRQGNQQLEGQLSNGTSVRLDEYQLLASLFRGSPSRVLDLVRIALGVYAVDRVSVRDWQQSCGGARWIRLRVGVADRDFWQTPDIQTVLQRILDLLSGDVWDITFAAQRNQHKQGFLGSRSVSDHVRRFCLYSGGLDSAAGLACQLRSSRVPIAPVTVYHQAGQGRRVKHQIRQLAQKYGAHLQQPVIVRTALKNPPPFKRQERTQRCRSFLFMAIGAAAAIAEGAREVSVYENGVGAINLPLMRGMSTGARTTRSSHPGFLRFMGELTTKVAGRPIVFALPHRGRTKAEIVQTLAEDGLGELACSTVSCVHYPVRHSRKQCGYCPACLGRRQALVTAGIEEAANSYQFDLFGASKSVNVVPDSKLTELKATLLHVYRLGELGSNPLPQWFLQYVIGTGVTDTERDLHDSVQLLRRFRAEWVDLIAQGQRNGWKWAQWFARNTSA